MITTCCKYERNESFIPSVSRPDVQFAHSVKHCSPSEFCQRASRFVFDLIFGLESKIPACCVAEWLFREYVLRQHHIVCHVAPPEGYTYDTNFVPCFIHRRLWVRPKVLGDINCRPCIDPRCILERGGL